MTWPWQRRPETRTTGNYTEQFTSALIAYADGGRTIGATAAVEAAVGLISRCFASAQVNARPGVAMALTPAILAKLARDTMRFGESIWLISMDGGRVELLPSTVPGLSAVRGGPRRST